MYVLFLPDEGDHSIIETLQLKILKNFFEQCIVRISSWCIITTATMTLKSYITEDVVWSDISQHSLLKRWVLYFSVERVWWLLSVSLVVLRKHFWFDVPLFHIGLFRIETADLAKSSQPRKRSIVTAVGWGGADHYKPPLAFYCCLHTLALQYRTASATETVTGTTSFYNFAVKSLASDRG